MLVVAYWITGVPGIGVSETFGGSLITGLVGEFGGALGFGDTGAVGVIGCSVMIGGGAGGGSGDGATVVTGVAGSTGSAQPA